MCLHLDQDQFLHLPSSIFPSQNHLSFLKCNRNILSALSQICGGKDPQTIGKKSNKTQNKMHPGDDKVQKY